MDEMNMMKSVWRRVFKILGIAKIICPCSGETCTTFLGIQYEKNTTPKGSQKPKTPMSTKTFVFSLLIWGFLFWWPPVIVLYEGRDQKRNRGCGYLNLVVPLRSLGAMMPRFALKDSWQVSKTLWLRCEGHLRDGCQSFWSKVNGQKVFSHMYVEPNTLIILFVWCLIRGNFPSSGEVGRESSHCISMSSNCRLSANSVIFSSMTIHS